MTDTAAVHKELRAKIRGYEGLSAKKLAGCPHTLEALGTTDPVEAVERFKAAVDQLPDDKFTGALKNAIGLGPYLKENLSEREIPYAADQSVSVETAKGWAERAIETLSQVLTAKPIERLTDIEVVLWVAGGRVIYRWVTSFWQQGDESSTRLDGQEQYIRRDRLALPFAAHQLGLDERPASLAIDVIFQNDQLPQGTFGFGGIDFPSFVSGSYEMQAVDGPKPSSQLLQDLRLDAEGALRVSSYYQVRWFDPQPLMIYGIAWY